MTEASATSSQWAVPNEDDLVQQLLLTDDIDGLVAELEARYASSIENAVGLRAEEMADPLSAYRQPQRRRAEGIDRGERSSRSQGLVPPDRVLSPSPLNPYSSSRSAAAPPPPVNLPHQQRAYEVPPGPIDDTVAQQLSQKLSELQQPFYADPPLRGSLRRRSDPFSPATTISNPNAHYGFSSASSWRSNPALLEAKAKSKLPPPPPKGADVHTGNSNADSPSRRRKRSAALSMLSYSSHFGGGGTTSPRMEGERGVEMDSHRLKDEEKTKRPSRRDSALNPLNRTIPGGHSGGLYRHSNNSAVASSVGGKMRRNSHTRSASRLSTQSNTGRNRKDGARGSLSETTGGQDALSPSGSAGVTSSQRRRTSSWKGGHGTNSEADVSTASTEEAEEEEYVPSDSEGRGGGETPRKSPSHPAGYKRTQSEVSLRGPREDWPAEETPFQIIEHEQYRRPNATSAYGSTANVSGNTLNHPITTGGEGEAKAAAGEALAEAAAQPNEKKNEKGEANGEAKLSPKGSHFSEKPRPTALKPAGPRRSSSDLYSSESASHSKEDFVDELSDLERGKDDFTKPPSKRQYDRGVPKKSRSGAKNGLGRPNSSGFQGKNQRSKPFDMSPFELVYPCVGDSSLSYTPSLSSTDTEMAWSIDSESKRPLYYQGRGLEPPRSESREAHKMNVPSHPSDSKKSPTLAIPLVPTDSTNMEKWDNAEVKKDSNSLPPNSSRLASALLHTKRVPTSPPAKKAMKKTQEPETSNAKGKKSTNKRASERREGSYPRIPPKLLGSLNPRGLLYTSLLTSSRAEALKKVQEEIRQRMELRQALERRSPIRAGDSIVSKEVSQHGVSVSASRNEAPPAEVMSSAVSEAATLTPPPPPPTTLTWFSGKKSSCPSQRQRLRVIQESGRLTAPSKEEEQSILATFEPRVLFSGFGAVSTRKSSAVGISPSVGVLSSAAQTVNGPLSHRVSGGLRFSYPMGSSSSAVKPSQYLFSVGRESPGGARSVHAVNNGASVSFRAPVGLPGYAAKNETRPDPKQESRQRQSQSVAERFGLGSLPR